ncbi:MAG: cyanophycinase [Candidatus Aminicenantes bacterium]|nr:cyanophycinase [Candidatus Aminicenantes bacterium]
MKRMLILFMSLHIFISLPAFSEAKGYLFIIGGGSRPESMMKKFVQLADKFNSGKIIIFPMASSVPAEVGPEQVEQLKKFGVREVEYHILTREQALSVENTGILDDIGGVFFSGGVQSRLMNILIDTPIHKKLLEIYEKGAVIGGTSAGAAVMSEVMITGGEKREVEEGHEFETIQADNIVTIRGLGFIKTAIIDQHFIRRKRHNRLISLVAENPNLLGIGIDESTAIIVSPDEIFEVVGERNVIVYDATQAQIRISSPRLLSGFKIIMHILSAEDRFSLKTKELIR